MGGWVVSELEQRAAKWNVGGGMRLTYRMALSVDTILGIVDTLDGGLAGDVLDLVDGRV